MTSTVQCIRRENMYVDKKKIHSVCMAFVFVQWEISISWSVWMNVCRVCAVCVCILRSQMMFNSTFANVNNANNSMRKNNQNFFLSMDQWRYELALGMRMAYGFVYIRMRMCLALCAQHWHRLPFEFPRNFRCSEEKEMEKNSFPFIDVYKRLTNGFRQKWTHFDDFVPSAMMQKKKHWRIN